MQPSRFSTILRRRQLLDQRRVTSSRVPRDGVQQRSNRGVEGDMHQPTSGVYTHVPLGSGLGDLRYKITDPRVVRHASYPPVLHKGKLNSNLSVNPLNESRTVPQFERSAAPDIQTPIPSL